ncbi:MAG: hypothetical protein ACK559_38490, partial [bacterium]
MVVLQAADEVLAAVQRQKRLHDGGDAGAGGDAGDAAHDRGRADLLVVVARLLAERRVEDELD